jgi:hypothetical protein
MRRLLAVSVMLVAAAGSIAGCTAKSGTTTWSSPGAKAPVEAPAPDAACGAIRTVVTADMAPLGKAFGSIVGRATASDKAGQTAAEAQAASALTKLGSDISTAGATAKDPAVRQAATTANKNITALSTDTTYLTSITTMDAITAATTKLQQATAPVATACDGS